MSIEVEKKLSLTQEEVARLVYGAEYGSSRTYCDLYFDYPDHRLTCADVWVRERAKIGGTYPQVKLPLVPGGRTNSIDRYKEISGTEEVLDALGLRFEDGQTFQGALAYAGLVRIADIETKRKKYHLDGFVIDVDDVSFGGDQGYSILEVEMLVDSEEQIPEAESRIFSLLHSKGISPSGDHVRGKLIEYLFRFRWEHFDQLVEAGVVK